jgi:hypothetical protein
MPLRCALPLAARHPRSTALPGAVSRWSSAWCRQRARALWARPIWRRRACQSRPPWPSHNQRCPPRAPPAMQTSSTT